MYKIKSLDNSLKMKHLLILFIIALTIRLLFSFYLQQFYFGDFVWKYGDGTSFLNPILNYMEHGIYMGDMFVEDSKYFRVPVYPGFLGLVYFVFGPENYDYAIAFIQSVLDSCSAVLVYLIIFKITQSFRMAIISGFIYATYPFIILWNPISYTEVVYMFILWVLIYVSTSQSCSLKKTFLQGALVGILVLTKQTLGLTLLIPMIIILLGSIQKKSIKQKIILLSVLFFGFVSVLTPWVIRNYIQSGKVIVLMGDTPGLRIYGKDFQSFEKFVQLFNENITPIMNDVVTHGKTKLEKHQKFVDKHQMQIQDAMQLAHECGPSFVQRRVTTYEGKAPYVGCEEEVILAFDQLTELFWQEVPMAEALETRIDAVNKIYSKSDIVNKNLSFSKTDFIKILLFKYRVLLLILGLIGIFLLIYKNTNRNFAIAVLITVMAAYGYFSLIIVHVEMRYLLMPDLLITIFASIPLVYILNKIKTKRSNLNK